MKTKNLLTVFILSALIACGQQSGATKKHIVDPKARLLNDSAVRLTMTFHDSLGYVKAISLLDQATAIDSNYFYGYYNKFSFQTTIKQYDKAIQTGLQLIRIRPNFPDFDESIGTVYYLTGDSVSGDKYFNDALVLYDKFLDTMSVNNKLFKSETMFKGNALIMLKRYDDGNKILKELYDKEKDDLFKQVIEMSMNKTRREILENIIQKISVNN